MRQLCRFPCFGVPWCDNSWQLEYYIRRAEPHSLKNNATTQGLVKRPVSYRTTFNLKSHAGMSSPILGALTHVHVPHIQMELRSNACAEHLVTSTGGMLCTDQSVGPSKNRWGRKQTYVRLSDMLSPRTSQDQEEESVVDIRYEQSPSQGISSV